MAFLALDSLSREAQSKIFQKFTQAEASTTRKYGGTGLGLAISKTLIELMGGRIGVESSLGDGAVFWFELTLKQSSAAEKAPEAAVTSLPEGVEPVVLLVEDNRVNQKIARKILEKMGCQVSIAVNGVQAVALVKANTYDLVLMDIQARLGTASRDPGQGIPAGNIQPPL